MPLVNTVLSFVMHGFSSRTPNNVLKVSLSTFTVLQIRELECSALLTDIIQKLKYLDEAGIVPYLCLGYEPADFTVHPYPPPPKAIEGGFIFLAWVSTATKIFSYKK